MKKSIAHVQSSIWVLSLGCLEKPSIKDTDSHSTPEYFDVTPDNDNDGYSSDIDCDDTNPNRFPGGVVFVDFDGESTVITNTIELSHTVSEPGILYLCDGNWNTTLLVASNDVSIVGNGQDATILSGAGFTPIIAASNITGFVIEGLTLANGNAKLGGGLYLNEVDIELREIRFEANQAEYGAGMYLDYGTAHLTDIEFLDNAAIFSGGGTYFSGSEAELNGVSFNNNTAFYGGGILLYNQSNATMQEITFEDNNADFGGGIYLYEKPSVVLHDATFINNTALTSGGGLMVEIGIATLDNVQFDSNTAMYGGGMLLFDSHATIDDTIFNLNSAEYGGGLLLDEYSDMTLSYSTFNENSAQVSGGGIYLETSDATVNTCDFSANLPEDLYLYEIMTSYTWGENVSFVCDSESCESVFR